MNLRISPDQLRFRLTLDDAKKLYKDKFIKDKIKIPKEGIIEFGIEIHQGVTLGEFIGSSLVLKIGPFDMQKVEAGDETIFSARIKDTDVAVVVEVDRMSRKAQKTQ
jgi:hypothetical protein